MSGEQFLPSGDATGDALAKSAGSGDHPLTNFRAAGNDNDVSEEGGNSFHPVGMSGEQFSSTGDATGDN